MPGSSPPTAAGCKREATVIDIPCLTLRESTERPLTLTAGSSRLVAPAALPASVEQVLSGAWPSATPVPLWDMEVGRRIRARLREILA